MKYFFSSPEGWRERLITQGVVNYLLSFAVDAKSCMEYNDDKNTLIIDSGAFSAWNKGKAIDIDEYVKFCSNKPDTWTFINLDVIPKTGSSRADIDKCCEQGWENYLYLQQRIKGKLMPVYHYGDNPKWLRKFMDQTDYIGISPANDTHESVKRAFLKQAFAVLTPQHKAHGLGYSSLDGLYMFPFYSVDSISFKKVRVYIDGQRTTFWANAAMNYIACQRVQHFLKIERDVTNYWNSRGITWEQKQQLSSPALSLDPIQ